MSYKKIRDAATVRYTPTGVGATVSTVESKLGNVLSIADYGAVGDGVTDDTTAIQNAVNALVPGDTLEFPSGRYIITGNITVAVGGVLFRGLNTTPVGGFWDGPVAHLISTSTSITVFELATFQGTQTYILPGMTTGTSPSLYTASDVSPQEVTFDGLSFHNRTGTILANGLIGIDCSAAAEHAVTARNCYFTFMSKGIVGAPGTQSQLRIENCFFLNNDVAPITTSGFFTKIHANRFHDGGPILTPTGAGGNVLITDNLWSGDLDSTILFDTSASTTVVRVQISNNQVDLVSGDAELRLANIAEFIFSSNICSDRIWVNILSTTTGALVQGNILTYTSVDSEPITVAGDNALISGNILINGNGNNVVNIEATASNTRVIGNSFLTTGGVAVAASVAVSDSGTDSIIGSELGVTTLGATGEIGIEDYVACTTGGITVTLPVAATVGSGKVVSIKDRDGNASGDNITIEGNGSETIDGNLNLVMAVNYESVTLVTDGSNWSKLSDTGKNAADIFNVKDYGALGDGSTADAVAIQTAIDAAESAGGGIVFFPAGTYMSAVTLIVDSDFVKIQGSGIGSTTIKAASAMTILLRMGPVALSLTSLEYCQVSNITLDGNATCTEAVLRGYNNHFCLYENLRIISGSLHGGFFDGDITELNTKNHVNIYRGIWTLNNGGEGLHWEGDKSSMYSDLFANNNGSHGFVWEASNFDEPSTLSELTQVVATNIIAATNTGDGIVWDGVAKFSAGNFLSHSNGGAGLRFRSTHNISANALAGANIGSSIASLVLRNNEAGGIVTDTDTFVTGCQFGEIQIIGSGTSTDLVGIDMRGWSNCSIASLYVASVKGTGVLMQDGTDPNSAGITCSRNSISRVNLNSNGTGSTLKHGMRIIGATANIHIGSIQSVSNDDSGAGYELSIEGTANNIHISDYNLNPSGSQQIQLTTSNIISIYFNGPNIETPIPTVGSTGEITIPPCEQLVFISGSTTISSIADSWQGRTVTLAFDESLSFLEGGGMFIEGTFSPTANSTMTFICKGTQWYEVSRMLN